MSITWNQLILSGGTQINQDVGSYQYGQNGGTNYFRSGDVWDFDFDSNGILYLVGFFSCFAGYNSSAINSWLGIISWNGTTALPLSSDTFVYAGYGPWVAIGCFSIKIINDIIYIGGEFTSIGTKNLAGIAKWDLNNSGLGWQPIVGTYTGSSIGLNAGGICHKLYYYNDILYIGGTSMSTITDGINTYTAQNLASINLSTGTIVDNSLNQLGINSFVYSLLIHQNILYICGNFTSAGGIGGFNNIASWDTNTATWITQNFNGGVTSSSTSVVFTMDMNPTTNDLYLGGYFNMVGGQPQNSIAVWDTSATLWKPISSSLFVSTDYVTYIYFTNVNLFFVGSQLSGLREIDVTGLVPNIIVYILPTNITGGGALVTPSFRKIYKTITTLYISGNFSTIDGVLMNGVSYYNIPIKTNYTIPTGEDLYEIFLPIQSGTTPGNNTGFSAVINGQQKDLVSIFQPYTSGSLAPLTNYKSSTYGNVDLNTIFQSNVMMYSVTNQNNLTYTEQTAANKTVLTFTVINNVYSNPNPKGSCNFQINGSATIYCVLVAAGGGGGGGDGYTGGLAAGGGGGGGAYIYFSFTNVGTGNYNINIGVGGPNGLGANKGGPSSGSGETYGISAFDNSDPSSPIIVNCDQGYGGGGYYDGSNSGPGGTILSNLGVTTIQQYTGANGGQGYRAYPEAPGSNTYLTQNQEPGSNISPLTPISSPIGDLIYSGGGGGGGNYWQNQTNYGGNAGSNGIGGTPNSYAVSNYNGQNATIYGAGGGGAGQNDNVDTIGGIGAPGLCIIWW